MIKASNPANTRPFPQLKRGALALICLAIFALSAFACAKGPDAAAETAQPTAETAQPAAETAQPAAAETPSLAESERIAAGETQLRLNAFIWDGGFAWNNSSADLQEFVWFTPENATFGSCVDIDDARAYVDSGATTDTLYIGETLDYTITQAEYIPVRDLDGEYLASATLFMHDPTGKIPDFSYTMDFYHRLVSDDYVTQDDSYVEVHYFQFDYIDVLFEPAESEPTLPYTVPDPVLYDCWVDETQWDDFSTGAVHAQNDIPFLFFWNDQVFVGKCASVGGLASVVYDYDGYNEQATVDGWYAFTMANPTFGWCDTLQRPYPYFDTADVTVTLADGTTQELHITEGSILEWNGVRYRWTQRLEKELLY